jgi:hypothetical protein
MKTPRDVLNSLQDYRAWANGKPRFDLIDYAMCTSTSDGLCAFLELAVPPLRLHDGSYFLEHNFDEATYEAWRSRLGSIEDVQRVMNHLHVSSFLQGEDVPDIVAVHIARGLAECWSRAFGHLGLEAVALGSTLQDAQVTLFRRAPG